MVILGLDPIVDTGIVVSTLAGAGIGAAPNMLVGALTKQGLPKDAAREYEGHVRYGRILLAARALSVEEKRQARDIFDGGSGPSPPAPL